MDLFQHIRGTWYVPNHRRVGDPTLAMWSITLTTITQTLGVLEGSGYYAVFCYCTEFRGRGRELSWSVEVNDEPTMNDYLFEDLIYHNSSDVARGGP